MEYLLTYLCTIALSYGIDFIVTLQMYKDIADNGYKFNNQKTIEVNNGISDDEENIRNNDKLYHLIPFLNIFNSMMKSANYLGVRNQLFNQMYYSGMIEEMDEYEKAEYSKHPNGLNAIIVPIKSQVRLARASKVRIETGLYRGDIYYTASDDLEEINILKVTGSLSRLSENEQKDKVREVILGFADAMMKEFLESEEFEKMLSTGEGFIVEKVMEDGKKVEMSNEEKKKVLQDFRNELLGQNENEENEKEYEEGPKLTKRN